MTNGQASVIGAIVGVACTVTGMMVYGGGNPQANAAIPLGDSPVPGPRVAQRQIAPTASNANPTASSAEVRGGCDDSRVQELEAELKRIELVTNLPEALSAEWPAKLPASYREPTFRSTVEDSLRECVAGARLAGLSCDEPPCIAVFALGVPSDGAEGVSSWPGRLDHCDRWRRVYGDGNQNRETSFIDCRNGRYEEAEVVSLYLTAWSGWEELDLSTRTHIDARRIERIKELREQATCSPQLR